MTSCRSSSADRTAASHAFARYCRSGDADALAEVFDLTAPRLAVLAGHLVPGDAHAVEDLVQTTFLEAMRAARRFEPGRPVLPWLVVILGRRAADLRRQRGRRARGPEFQELADTTLDPARLAIDRELAAQVAAAVENLEAPYREVLALRLVHGLSPVEIARALDRPLGTVHAQLHRGGERLRRALPRLTALCIDIATPQLAAVRARVLAAAREGVVVATPASAALATLGVLLMTKKMLVATVLAPLALTGAFAWLAPPALSVAASSEDPNPEIAAADTTDAPARVEDIDRVALPSGTTQSEAPRSQLTLRARVIAEETGAPLAGCEVSAIRADESVDPPNDATPDSFSTTDADGRFEVRLDLAPAQHARILIRSAGRVPMCAWLDKLRPEVEIDSGDVPMMRGAELRLRVRDENGDPVQSFAIQLRERRLHSTDDRFYAKSWGGNRFTDADGIAGPYPVAAGDAQIEFAEGTGHVFRGPMLVHVPNDRPEMLVDLTVYEPESAETIAGVVTDERGIPLVGVDVAAQLPSVAGYMVSRSFGSGRFLLHFQSGAEPATITRVGNGGGGNALDYEVVAPREPVPFGTRDLRVIARRLPKTDVTLRVVRAGDRSTVESFRAIVVPVAHRREGTELGRFGTDDSLRLGSPARHPGGILRLPALPPIDHLVVVAPDDPTLAPVVFQELRPDPQGDATLEIAVPPSVSWKVRVTDARGEPIAGSRVALVQGVGRTRVTPQGYTLSWEEVFDRGVWGTKLSVEIAVATTDVAGIATLRSQAGVAGCGLRVRGARHLERFEVLEDDVAPDEVRTVVVAPAARIVARLTPPELVAALGPSAKDRAMLATQVDGEAKLADANVRVSLRPLGTEGDEVSAAHASDEGRCALDGVPPGDYAVFVNIMQVGEVHSLQPGEERVLTIDLRQCAPARVSGQVLLDGAPLVGVASVALFDRDWNANWIWTLDRDGRFGGSIAPGKYHARLQLREDFGVEHEFDLDEPIVVLPGAEIDRTLAFTRRRVDFHVTDRNGAGCARTWIALYLEDASNGPNQRVAVVSLDAQGRGSLQATWAHPLLAVLWLDWLRNGERTPRRTIPLGRVAVAPGQTSAAYDFTVDPSALPH